MYNMKGIGELIVLGIGALIVLVATVPMVLAYGLAWMLEPRVGAVIWTIHFWASLAWGLAVAAFFGSAFLWRR